MEFDAPLFKRLSHNDTRQARGHQGGILIPRALEPFLPELQLPTPQQPTSDIVMAALLAANGLELGMTETRYQYQSWGSRRRPECRLTRGLSEITRQARAGDILLIRRGIDDPLLLHLELISQLDANGRITRIYRELLHLTGQRLCGILERRNPPVSQLDVLEAQRQQLAREQQPFLIFDPAARHQESKQQSIARSRAFRNELLPLYDNSCAICGNGLHTRRHYEVQAAHIVPRSVKGVDDCRNGILLCHSHHWAFDKGLFSFNQNRQVILSPGIIRDQRNDHLTRFEGNRLREPNDQRLRPDDRAIDWHRTNIARIP